MNDREGDKRSVRNRDSSGTCQQVISTVDLAGCTAAGYRTSKTPDARAWVLDVVMLDLR